MKQRCAFASSSRCRPESAAAFPWLMHGNTFNVMDVDDDCGESDA